MPDKERKVSFNTIISKKWRTKEETAFNSISETVKYVLKQKKIDKHFDLKGDKFCFLQNVTFTQDDGCSIIAGFFISARHTFRPNLIDRATSEERKSPKKLTEGDIEKTHFVIKICRIEVFLILEINGNGVTVNQIVEYFDRFTKRYIHSLNKKKGFSLNHTKVAREDFLKVLKKMKRVHEADIFFNKSLLGSECLKFSNRTTSLKRDLILTLKAEKAETITETVVDIFNSFSKGDSISKVRIRGRDENGTNVTIDTGFIEKIDHLDVDINPETGEVMTVNILTGLKGLSKQLK